MDIREYLRAGTPLEAPVPQAAMCGDVVTLRVIRRPNGDWGSPDLPRYDVSIRPEITRLDRLWLYFSRPDVVEPCGLPLSDWPFVVTATRFDWHWTKYNTVATACPVCIEGRDDFVQYAKPLTNLARPCAHCSRLYLQRAGVRSAYCSMACHVAAYERRTDRVCVVCDSPLPPSARADKVTCGPACRQRLSRANRQATA